eukprot:628311-Pyramimonas_sp.AAC.1
MPRSSPCASAATRQARRSLGGAARLTARPQLRAISFRIGPAATTCASAAAGPQGPSSLASETAVAA